MLRSPASVPVDDKLIFLCPCPSHVITIQQILLPYNRLLPSVWGLKKIWTSRCDSDNTCQEWPDKVDKNYTTQKHVLLCIIHDKVSIIPVCEKAEMKRGIQQANQSCWNSSGLQWPLEALSRCCHCVAESMTIVNQWLGPQHSGRHCIASTHCSCLIVRALAWLQQPAAGSSRRLRKPELAPPF